MSTAPFDVPRAHRWFAVELNNLAWDLLEKSDRSPDDNERLVHAAHAACFHWLQAGDVLNHLRAQCLLATVYAKVDLSEAAVRHAEKCLQLSEHAGAKQTAFDLATSHGCAASAYRLVGRLDDAQTQYQRAITAAARFDDPAERGVFDGLYPAP